MKTNPPETTFEALLALDDSHTKVAALLQLTHAQFIGPEEESMFSMDWENGRLRHGLAVLYRDVVSELDARQAAVREALAAEESARKAGAR